MPKRIIKRARRDGQAANRVAIALGMAVAVAMAFYVFFLLITGRAT